MVAASTAPLAAIIILYTFIKSEEQQKMLLLRDNGIYHKVHHRKTIRCNNMLCIIRSNNTSNLEALAGRTPGYSTTMEPLQCWACNQCR